MANPSTLVNVRDLIKARSKVQGDPDFPNTLLDRIINDSQRNVALRLFHLGWKELKGTDSLTLSGGKWGDEDTKQADLTSDCPNRMGIPNWLIMVETTGATYNSYAYPISDRVFHEHLTNSYLAPTEKQPKCTIGSGDELHLAPDTIASATAFYYKNPTDLSSDSDTMDIPEEFVDFVVQRVILEIDDVKGRLQDKESALNKLESEIGKSFEALKIQTVEKQQETASLQ